MSGVKWRASCSRVASAGRKASCWALCGTSRMVNRLMRGGYNRAGRLIFTARRYRARSSRRLFYIDTLGQYAWPSKCAGDLSVERSRYLAVELYQFHKIELTYLCLSSPIRTLTVLSIPCRVVIRETICGIDHHGRKVPKLRHWSRIPRNSSVSRKQYNQRQHVSSFSAP